MSNLELQTALKDFCNTWHEFKAIKATTLKNGAPKPARDPLVIEQLSRINEDLSAQQETIERLQVALRRPGADLKELDSTTLLEHKKAFSHYLRTGENHNLRMLEKKALNSAVNSEGGFLMPQSAVHMITESLNAQSPLRSLASVINVESDILEIIEDFDEAYAGWTHEAESRNETKAPLLSKKVIAVHEMYAQPKATQKLIDDASIDIEEWLSHKLVDAFSRLENASFIHGDGIGKPQGILSYPAGTGVDQIEQILSGKQGELTAESLFKLYYSLHERFAVKGKFLMSRSVLQACRLLIDPNSGEHLWRPASEIASTSTLLGCEVVQSADMPSIGVNKMAIAFGDFASAYQIVDRKGISILQDPFTEKPFVKFYATKRVGGGMLNGCAMKLLCLSA